MADATLSVAVVVVVVVLVHVVDCHRHSRHHDKIWKIIMKYPKTINYHFIHKLVLAVVAVGHVLAPLFLGTNNLTDALH